MHFTTSNYYSAMDEFSDAQNISAEEELPLDEEGNFIAPDDSLNFGPNEIGTTTNPMTHQTEALKARIREGASRIEFSFLGAGKGSSQRPTPETFGKRERQDIRELLNINNMKTSTHAAVHMDSLSGFSQRGFNEEARSQVLNEIRRAIHFAGEATKGGAIVFHLTEWPRPLTDIETEGGPKFKGYGAEEKEAILFAVDDRTGDIVATIKKDQIIHRPKYITAEDMNLVGQEDPAGNGTFEKGDWVDIKGNRIPRFTEDTKLLFDRVPDFDSETTSFKVQPVTWKDLVKETEEYNKKNDTDIRPEVMYAKIQLENQTLQYKGNSLYHAREYEARKRDLDKLRQRMQLLQEMKKNTKPEDQWQLRRLVPDAPSDQDPETHLNEQIHLYENTLRHIHETSAMADVGARQAQETIEHIKSAQEYGLDKTAETIAYSAIEAMKTYEKNKGKYGLTEPLYVAPENWDPRRFGSHPEEYKQVIDSSRKKFVEMLMDKQSMSKEKAEKLAKTHIKGTLDIGHMNLLRRHHQGKEEDFEEWMLEQAEELVKEGYVGHIHLTDNFGFDDEHVTPGQGNVPMKEFLKRLEKHGVKDIIVEPGSYNFNAHLDTMELVNSPIYGSNRKMRFRNIKDGGFGYNAPGFFIAGAYAPSNDWRPWSDLGLE